MADSVFAVAVLTPGSGGEKFRVRGEFIFDLGVYILYCALSGGPDVQHDALLTPAWVNFLQGVT